MSTAGVIAVASILIHKYGREQCLAALPAHTTEIGFIIAGLCTFNFAMLMSNAFPCHC
jgi:hypothetical protein